MALDNNRNVAPRHRHRPTGRVISASWNIKAASFVLLLSWLGVCLSGAVAPDVLLWARLVIILLGFVGLGVALRWARSHVMLTSDTIRIVGIVRRREIPRDAVQRAELVTAGLFGWRTPRLTLVTGKRVSIGFLCDGPLTRTASGGRASELVAALSS